MYYVITDSEGTTLDTFRDEREAEQGLLAMVAAEQGAENELLLLAHEDDGTPVGGARLYEDVLRARTTDLAAASALARSNARLVQWYATTASTQTIGSAIIATVKSADLPQPANATDDRVTVSA